MESWHLSNLSVQIAPDFISEYLNFQNFPDPPSKSRLRPSKWALSRPYCQYSELCHKQKKARNALVLSNRIRWSTRSKPFLKSVKNHLAQQFPRSSASSVRCRRYTIACCVAFPAIANCLGSRR